jgi:hypothetical protein
MIRQAGYTMTCDTCGAVVADPDTTAWHLLRECAAAGWERFAEKDRCPKCLGREETPMAECTDSLLTRLATERPTLYALMGEMARRLLGKGHDYSSLEGEWLENLLECEKMGIPAWKGAIIRKSDKWSRIRLYAAREMVRDKEDSFEDDLIDDANYDLLCVLLHRRAREADRKPLTASTGTVTAGRAGQVQCFPEGWPLHEVPSALAIQPPVPTPTERR